MRMASSSCLVRMAFLLAALCLIKQSVPATMYVSRHRVSLSLPVTWREFLFFSPPNEEVASRAVFRIKSESDGRTETNAFGAN